MAVALYEMTDTELALVPESTFAAERVLERQGLQRVLRNRLDGVAPGVMLVGEEFSAFQDSDRRIDLLGVDTEARPVVVELKRTGDGGHVELQALRYAAMVSALTFDDLVVALERDRARHDPGRVEDAREDLAHHLAAVGGEEADVSREVRLVLVAAGFDVEVTTTVLWLTEVYGLDIRCVRLTPHRVDGRLLVAVDQVVPLPEAAELKVRLRRRAEVARVRADATRDWTPIAVTTPSGTSKPLRKRQAVRAMVVALHAHGVRVDRMLTVVSKGKLLRVPGGPADEALPQAFVDAHPGAERRLGRWFLDSPLREADATWVLSKMWGIDSAATLDGLVALAPQGGCWGWQAVPAGFVEGIEADSDI